MDLNSSVTESSIKIILSGMTYYHHWFEEFVKSKYICVNFFQMNVNFFQMKVPFRIYLIVWMVRSSQILLDCVWPFELRFLSVLHYHNIKYLFDRKNIAHFAMCS